MRQGYSRSRTEWSKVPWADTTLYLEVGICLTGIINLLFVGSVWRPIYPGTHFSYLQAYTTIARGWVRLQPHDTWYAIVRSARSML